MTVEIAYIDNTTPPHWYGCTFVVHKGTPLLIECRYVAGKPDMPLAGKNTPRHVYTNIIASIERIANEKGIALVGYPDKDKVVDSAVRAKKRGLNAVDIANAALKKFGESPAGALMRDGAELQRLIEEARKNGAFFPHFPVTKWKNSE